MTATTTRVPSPSPISAKPAAYWSLYDRPDERLTMPAKGAKPGATDARSSRAGKRSGSRAICSPA